ncbi:MAG TPA: hypothetical protein VG368_04910 [Acidimicrobiales bacterium]|jgi:sRNA-binding carbon storage regulator CsrA|nr:hypothetical protein [Acidimicrobiales bacterium]
MLVNTRRVGQGIVFDGSFRLELQALRRFSAESHRLTAWLSVVDSEATAAPVISPLSATAAGDVRIAICAPRTIERNGSMTIVSTEGRDDTKDIVVLSRTSDETVVIDGIPLTFALQKGSAPQPLLRFTPTSLGEQIDVCVVEAMPSSSSIATGAPRSVRILRSEIWTPVGNDNEKAASWTTDSLEALSRRPLPLR